jgi:type IV secretory pathway VirB4 component
LNLSFKPVERLFSKKLNTGTKGPSTLKFVDVQEIRDGIVVLRNGSIRAILAVSSINFDLKSTQEQEAIIAQYQNYLNSLDFPSQIVIQKLRRKPDPSSEYYVQELLYCSTFFPHRKQQKEPL